MTVILHPNGAQRHDLSAADQVKLLGYDLERAEHELQAGNTTAAMVLLELARQSTEALTAKVLDRRRRMEYKELAVDVAGREAWLKGERIQLPRREFELLAVLIADPERVWDKGALYERCWGADLSQTSRSLDTVASRLRRTLHGEYVQTVRGVGYRLGPVAP